MATIGEPKFYYDCVEEYLDNGAIVKVRKTVCLKEIKTDNGIFYAIGNSVQSALDKDCKKTGRKIAEQRASQAIRYFHAVNYSLDGYDGIIADNANNFAEFADIFPGEELNDLERKIFGLDIPPEERVKKKSKKEIDPVESAERQHGITLGKLPENEE